MRGEAQTVRSELQVVPGKVPSVRNEMRSLEKRMDDGFTSIRNELAATNKRLDDALDMRERLAALEGKMSARTN